MTYSLAGSDRFHTIRSDSVISHTRINVCKIVTALCTTLSALSRHEIGLRRHVAGSCIGTWFCRYDHVSNKGPPARRRRRVSTIHETGAEAKIPPTVGDVPREGAPVSRSERR